MANNIERLSDNALTSLTGVMHSAIAGNEAAYGLTPADSAALQAGLDNFKTLIGEAWIAQAAAKSATAAKNAGRGDLVVDVASVVRRLNANRAVTDTLLAEAGLSVRNRSKRRIIPKAPASLTANPSATGNVRLKWHKNGNKYGVIYLVDASEDGLDWRLFATTSKCQVEFRGFEPGVTAWFRIRATKNEKTTAASNAVAIYPKHKRAELKQAA